MSKFYNVPVVAQPSHNTCWHASSLMIWYYWQGITSRQGPMNTLGKNYSNDLPISAQQFIDLAGKVGLKKVDQQYNQYSSAILLQLLTRYGPLWCAGHWYGVGHVIVLTGIKDDNVYVNDPDGGIKKTGTAKWFNEKLAKYASGCLMYKDPAAY
jgi:ABC-type bacteriocin/lantibiotic exporter with double-glycine peptidase domain